MSHTTEIERKFLVPSPPEDLQRWPHSRIRQGYLSIDDINEVRLRDRDGRFFETIKGKGHLQRSEHEVELDRPQFEALWPATGGRRVEKTRYEVEEGGWLIEVDVYHGRLEGLVTAEVEFESRTAAADFAPPSWLGTEVTADPRYKNRRLAVDGLP